MQTLWLYLKPHKFWVILSLLLAGAAQILSLIDPLIFGKIIDDYALNPAKLSEQESIKGIMLWLLIAVVVALLARLAKTFQDYVMKLVVQKFGMQIFNDGLKQTIRLPYHEFEGQRSGQTLSILQKVKTDTERFISSFINILFSSIVGVGFLVWYAFTTHWSLIPVFLIGVLVLGGLTGLLSRKIKTIQRSIVRETAEMSGAITESLRNIELVKSMGLTYPEIRRLKEHTQKIFDLEIAKVKKVRTLSFLQGTALNLLRQSILFILLWLIFRNVLSAGELVSMQVIINIIFGPLQELGNIILTYREASASLQTFDQLMKKEPEYRPESPVKIGPLQTFRFENVVFRHKNAKYNAIDQLSFEANIGDTLAFVGPSGSGKSTLVKLLVGLYTPISGEIYYNDLSIKEIRYNEARRQLGFVTQDIQLFAGTIKENLLFAKPDATDDEIMSALEKAACLPMLKRSEKGLNTKLGESGMKLSGGEKQRLSIARALIRNPRLLIFDEATSALDSLTEEEITETIITLSEKNEQITILIAHRLSTIMHANTIFVLERGKIVETGNHDELVEQKGLYYAMWRQQIGERQMEFEEN
ncbi:ABC transporter ATP-binding protein [Solitalea canadensis]|uniref:ABC-type multidrug transport system, ATPase and permease component n=1 Tax=Solitalea canadensis (strain ATCC 29591 / DSM 3403 / JCM 21819 / LMG 8368 / NBRC 15130 / NCIMB 12057 / USAM 9D) TaxID=929556 RepID=H8KLJ7_SOLCM|nr:ABC transporter ATP-binding protein [Solitalea canadensis]AFD08884.1 ABC-type multidrug transport system, ATPase and permease component [Solitalea canadensis DSM 3403]